MEQEFEKYLQLVKLYPKNKIYYPLEFKHRFNIKNINSFNLFDINLTRYLYIRKFNSIPPDDIWSFRTMLGYETNTNTKTYTHNLEIKIGILKNEKLQTDVINLEVNSTDTYDNIISELKSKGLNCELLINENSPIERKKQIGNTKSIYGVCL
jgi:hypothetical protein